MNELKFVFRTLYREHGKGLRAFLRRHPVAVRAALGMARGVRDAAQWLWRMPKPARATLFAAVALWVVFSTSERVEAHSKRRFCNSFPNASFCHQGGHKSHLNVPELDPAAGTQAFVLVVGGAAILFGRRRRGA